MVGAGGLLGTGDPLRIPFLTSQLADDNGIESPTRPPELAGVSLQLPHFNLHWEWLFGKKSTPDVAPGDSESEPKGEVEDSDGGRRALVPDDALFGLVVIGAIVFLVAMRVRG